MSRPARIIRQRDERSPVWHVAWAALDDIERRAKHDVARANTYAAAEVIDAVQRARAHLTRPGM